MAEISNEEYKKAIAEVLKTMDLATTGTKQVRKELEKKFGTDLSDKRKLIDKLVMEYVDSMDTDEDEEEEEPLKKPSKKKSSEKKSEDDDLSDEEEKSPKMRTRGAGKKKPEKKKKIKGTKVTKKGNAFTRPQKLSPELAELMGAKELPRCEVVKRMSAIIKERQLLDPNNRQFTICDKELYNIFGTQRFHTFGMMKYLKHHFVKEE